MGIEKAAHKSHIEEAPVFPTEVFPAHLCDSSNASYRDPLSVFTQLGDCSKYPVRR
jgi:hypothetical protein